MLKTFAGDDYKTEMFSSSRQMVQEEEEEEQEKLFFQQQKQLQIQAAQNDEEKEDLWFDNDNPDYDNANEELRSGSTFVYGETSVNGNDTDKDDKYVMMV